MDHGNLMSVRAQVRTHSEEEQHAPDEHREIASFNTNNEFNPAINEKDIDFNIPGVPHSTVKQSHGAGVRDLIQKIEKSKEMIHEVGNVELCELLEMEPKAQCKVCLSYWDAGIVDCTCGQYTMDLLSIHNFYIKKGRPHGHRYGKKSQGITSTSSRIRSRRNARRSSSWVSTTGSSATRSSARICLTSVALKNYVVRWTNWRTKTTRTT